MMTQNRDSASNESRSEVIRVEDLTKRYQGRSGIKTPPAVDGISFELYRGEILGLLGESGCGKTTLARMLVHLIRPTSGRILLNGSRIDDLPESSFRRRRREIQMVYQNPFDCLDPSMRVLRLLEEPMKIWQPRLSRGEMRERIVRILGECGLPEESLRKYPGEFSGGQLQRLSIARALLIEPDVLIADEIISALDVSVQSQILDLLLQMKEKHSLSILFITHDLSVAEKVSGRVMVMRDGQIRGIGAPAEVFTDPTDPYIRDLRRAVFTFD